MHKINVVFLNIMFICTSRFLQLWQKISDNSDKPMYWMTFIFHVQSVKKQNKTKQKENTPIYFHTKYHTEMKLVPIIMDYCVL